jgi:thiamine kinase-like enzyme
LRTKLGFVDVATTSLLDGSLNEPVVHFLILDKLVVNQRERGGGTDWSVVGEWAVVVDLVRRVPGWEDAEPTVTSIVGGITNRNFRVDIHGRSFVVRLPGERTELLGIDRAGEAETARRAAGLGVAPAVIAELPGVGTLVTEYVEGEPATSDELLAPGVLEAVTASIRRLHGSGPTSAAFPIFRVIEQHARDAAANGGAVPAIYGELHTVAQRIERALPPARPVPCHNDLLPANVLLTADRHWLIDFEYAGMNDALFDLANLSVNCAFDEAADIRLLDAYDGDVSHRRLARLNLMKVISELREGMWAAVQKAISTLDDFDFAAYARDRLEHCAELAATPAFAGWLRESAT